MRISEVLADNDVKLLHQRLHVRKGVAGEEDVAVDEEDITVGQVFDETGELRPGRFAEPEKRGGEG